MIEKLPSDVHRQIMRKEKSGKNTRPWEATTIEPIYHASVSPYFLSNYEKKNILVKENNDLILLEYPFRVISTSTKKPKIYICLVSDRTGPPAGFYNQKYM